ncbi:ABC transporter substrate binding protein [Pseudodesulfovibrio sp. zrk46]|uniref:ABC transporter substrate-binding protein n=1 Tax=Pseudodesulfovibrio sp. zrk46 TaxID=2725288 RepID=UPI0014491E96|nr:ABC transporter substrate binding protein [Pseudodesulfovibrio sp. zrk46]QJB58266.1 sugar ABC transporter [Pseudodesulfovibrio sp. zrk46]
MQRKTAIIILLAVMLFLTGTAYAQLPEVMIVNSYHAEYPWVAAHNQGLQDNLKGRAELSVYYLDSKKLSLEEAQKNAQEVLSIIKNDKPSLVIMTDDFALQELGLSTMNEGIPVVFLGINNNPRQYLGSMTLATGVLERPLLKRSIAYIQEILKSRMNKCLVLFDNGVTAQVTLKTVFSGKKRNKFSKTTTDIELMDTFANWKKTVLTAKDQGYEAIILGLYHTLVDENGNHVSDELVANWTSTHSPVPVFGFWDFSIGKNKALGGLVLSGYPQGEAAARLANKILRGREPNTIQPVTAEHGRFVFSISGLKRWNITLPSYFKAPNEPITFVD